VSFFVLETEWSPTGNVWDSADAGILDALFKWLWGWWRQPPIQARQVKRVWATGIYSAVLSVLVLASDTVWLAVITDWSVAEASAEELNKTWVCKPITNPFITECSVGCTVPTDLENSWNFVNLENFWKTVEFYVRPGIFRVPLL